jgi:plastocyanin
MSDSSGRRGLGLGFVLGLGLALALARPVLVLGDDGPGGPRPPAGGVQLEGMVTYEGPLPDPVPVHEAGTARRLVEIHRETGGLRDAAVWLEGVPEAGHRPPLEPLVMDQANYFFLPHVLMVEAGREVEFRNSDGANHGVTAGSPEERNRFNVITPPGGSYTRRFVAARQPVAIGCPLHTAMAGWIFVLDHPYHAVTDDRGEFRLPPVPPGRYTLHVRHPSGGMRREVEVVAREGEATPLRVEFHGEDLKVGRPGEAATQGSP